MCGFVVLIEPKKKFSNDILSKIEKKIFHRGPDSGGILNENGISMVFRRLSILDLRKISDQPMVDKKNSVSIVFNGEIYNFLELKKKLIKKGYFFKTNSDTEVILKGYLEWGEEISNMLEGMFAFAIFDKKKKNLFVSRDHLGIKPLYFFSNGKFIYIGSEISPLKNFIDLQVDKESLSEILFFRYASGKSTGYKNIFKIPAGYNYSINIETLNVRRTQYFDLAGTFYKNKKMDLNLIESTLFKSINKHTQSDVGFSIQLSGGLDSSLLVSSLYKMSGRKIDTFSLSIDAPDFNEYKYRKIVNELYPTNHHEIFFDSYKFANSFEKTIESLESPTTHFGCVLLYELCKVISKTNKVVLTGEGADEIFGGYSRYIDFRKILLMKKISTYMPNQLINRIPKLRFLENYKLKNSFKQLITFRVFDIFEDIFHEFSPNYEKIEELVAHFSKPRDKLAIYDQKIYLESLLVRQDKVSMAHGVESRVPFVDVPLIVSMNSFPEDKRYHNKITKHVLKKIAKKFFPRNFIYRKKNGLNLPISQWLNDKRGFGRFLDLFDDPNFKLLDYADKDKIKNLVNQFRTKNDPSLAKVLSQLINIEVWLRKVSTNKNL